MAVGGTENQLDQDGAERYASERFTRAFGRPREDGASRRWRCVLADGGVWIELKRNPVSGALSLRIEPERSDAHALISKIKFTELRDPAQVDVVIGELEAEGAARERGAAGA
jgi:hypothetical protein